MSEPSRGTVGKLSIRSVAGGFIVSWKVPNDTESYAHFKRMGLDKAHPELEFMSEMDAERVCGGLPELLALISETIKVTS